MAAADYEGQIRALNRAHGVIQFDMDGKILAANENYLEMMGYSLSEVVGRKHTMFIEPWEFESHDYAAFWAALKRGEYHTGVYRRVGKNGRTVWIHASYSPILDLNGNPDKVVKFATDVTQRIEERLYHEHIQQSIDADLAAITSAVELTDVQARGAASASAQMSTNIQAIAAGSEGLAQSIGEISRQMNRAAAICAQAVEDGSRADAIVAGLTSAATRIGEVINLINHIAAQTNMLALNATIEAARAGEYGKGFAVVASEVKTLAGRTEKATGEIARQIAEVQGVSSEMVLAIGKITNTIDDINAIATGISRSVNQQNDVTRAMSSNMQATADVIGRISTGMNEIAAATRIVHTATQKVKDASRGITRESLFQADGPQPIGAQLQSAQPRPR
jgi:methyl-accepting chemotaxis protein